MSRTGFALPGWYLAETFGITDKKEQAFAGQLVAALEKISPELTPRLLKHPLVAEIARGADAFDDLIARYGEAKDDADRGLALDAIAEILAHRDVHPTHALVTFLEQTLTAAKNEKITTLAARALASTGYAPFLELQKNLLASKSLPEVRIAVRLLGYGAYTPAAGALMELLRTDQAILADALLWSLGELGQEEAVPLIQHWLTRGELVDEALTALGKIGSRASVVRIIPFLLEGSRGQREKAAEALARITRANDGALGDPGLDNMLKQTLEKVLDSDESRVTRFHAMIAYSLLGGHLDPPRMLAALGGQLSQKDVEAVGGIMVPRTGGTPGSTPGGPAKPKKGRRGV